MIGAMPAIAVRRDRKKADGSIGFIGRPHKLSLHFRPPLTHHQVTPTPSPVNSPPGQYLSQRETAHHRFARNFLSKRCIFQLSVLAPLVGTILLFIGLVQLTPGAEANSFGIPLIVAGAGAFIVGLVVIAIRMYFKWELNRLNSRSRTDVPQIKVNEPSCTDTDVEKNQAATAVADSGGAVPPDINITVNEGSTENNRNNTRPSTIQEEAGGDKGKVQGEGTEETSKLLEKSKSGGDETAKNGSGPTSVKANQSSSESPSGKVRRSSCIGGGGSKGNSKNV